MRKTIIINRPGTSWPEADITVVDLATFAREGYNAELSIAYTSLVNTVNDIAERDQFLGRPICFVVDEGHIVLKNPLLSPFSVKATKMWRKLGLWFWLSIQNLENFPAAAQPMLSMIEWWICLSMPPDEVEKVARFRELSAAQKRLLLSARKESGKFSEGVVLSKSMEVLFRAVLPSINLAGHDRSGREERALQAHEGASQRALLRNTVGPGFFATTGMKLVAGRLFDVGHSDDESGFVYGDKDPGRVFSVILDRSAAAQIGFASPQAAIGQMLYVPPLIGPQRPLRIVGVVADQSLHLIGLGATANAYTQASAANDTPYTLIRISHRNVAATLARIDALWNRLSPNVPLKRRFVDELFEESYEILRNINSVFSGLALFACLIAVMGPFGMAIHITGKRRHEIGVRKTLGGSTRQVCAMLLKDFFKPVLIANLLAWPVAFVAAQVYLSLFSNRIALTPVPFVLSLAITLLIAWIAVGAQAWRAARVLPARVLRYE